MCGRLEVVAVKINYLAFLDSTQAELTHTIYKLVTNADFCVINQTDTSFLFFCGQIKKKKNKFIEILEYLTFDSVH